MLPPAYSLPMNVLLVLAGALACFAGYRQFKIVLAMAGFIIGGMAASSMMSPGNTVGLIVAALVGGLAGAVILFFAYFVGIALAGAGLGALLAHVGWGYLGGGDPPALLLIVLAVLGAIGAMVLQRYVIIVATAFGGAWTIIGGGLALATSRATAHGAPSGDVWILYPTSAGGQGWVPIAWIVLGLIGTAVQLGTSGKKR
jgi:hypothetical protein